MLAFAELTNISNTIPNDGSMVMHLSFVDNALKTLLHGLLVLEEKHIVSDTGKTQNAEETSRCSISRGGCLRNIHFKRFCVNTRVLASDDVNGFVTCLFNLNGLVRDYVNGHCGATNLCGVSLC